MRLTSISFFTSGACFGAVVGVLLGYMAFADQQREERLRDASAREAPPSQASAAPTSGAPERTPSFAALRFPAAIEREVEADLASMRATGKQGMDMILPLLAKWKEALKADPTQLKTALKLARLYSMAGKFDQAAEYLARAVEIDQTAPHLLLFAQALYHAKRWPAAAEYAEQAAKLEPANADAHELLIVASFQAKDLPRARDAGKKALELVRDPADRARIERRLAGLAAHPH